jgi:hypothetical protein
LDPMGKMFQYASSLKPLGQLKPNCPGIIVWRSSKVCVFYADPKSKMAAYAGYSFNTVPTTILENIEKIFFLKTTELNEPILCMNDHWMVSY